MKIFITGGAGFICANAAKWFSAQGHEVVIFDNLSRPGSDKNLAWLEMTAPAVRFIRGDIRDRSALKDIFTSAAYAVVLHCAAQVAVTTSVLDPEFDCAVNVNGTLHLLEAVRRGQNPQAVFLYTSTNKVYGGLEPLQVEEAATRYQLPALPAGIPETMPLDFHSPYGCSKGAADQYVRDYARIYGMNTVVFRQSCIYGSRQMGVEDQGWVAWIASRAILGRPARVYGSGKQVRDLLFIDDLVAAYAKALQAISTTRGRIYNLGGGPTMALSILELLEWLKHRYPAFTWEHFDWRPGDQKVYVSDVRMAESDFGWRPTTTLDVGLPQLMTWVEGNREVFNLP